MGDQGNRESYAAALRRFRPDALLHVAWNGVDRFLVVWTSLAGPGANGSSGFDLFGQMYSLRP